MAKPPIVLTSEFAPENPARPPASYGGAQRLAVLVLGMHRSGTSALARVLSLLGCDLPCNLMGSDVGNEAGHWESHAAVSLNDAVLASAGSRWDDWLPLNPGWYASPVYADFLERGRALLREDFGASRLFVMKDPRNCRLMPFWLAALAAEGITPLVALPVRNPLEVAESLAARDGMDIEFGLLLWLRHVLDAEWATRGQTRAFCGFEQLLDGWQMVAGRLENGLGVVWPRRSVVVDGEITAFLEPARRHHVQASQLVLGNASVSAWVRQCYEVMLRWTMAGEAAADWPLLDDIRSGFDRAGPGFAPLVLANLRQSRGVGAAARERAELAEARERYEQAEACVRDHVERGDALVAKLLEQDDVLTDRVADLAAMSAGLLEVEQLLACERATKNRAEAELVAAREEAGIACADAALWRGTAERADVERGELARGLAQQDAQLAAMRGQLDQTLAEVAALREAGGQAGAERADMAARLGDLDAALMGARADAAQARSDNAVRREADERAEEKHRELAQKLTQQLAGREAALAKSDADLVRAGQEAMRAQAQLAAQMLAREQAEARADRVEGQIASLESRLVQQREETSQAWAEAAAERGARQALAAEGQRLIGQNHGLTERLLQLGERMASLSADLRLAEDQAVRGQVALVEERREQLAALATAQNAEQRLEVQVAGLCSQLDQRATELAQLTGLFAEAQAELATELASRRGAEAQLAAAMARADAVAGQLAQAGGAVVGLEADLARERQHLADARYTALRLEADLAAGTSELTIAQDAVGRCESELVARKADLEGVATQLAEARAGREAVEARLEERYGEVAALTRELAGQAQQADASSADAQWLRGVSAALLAAEPWWWQAVPPIWRRKRQVARLQAGGLFDTRAYLARYPDVAASGIDPLRHYILHGMHEGRGH